MTNKMIVAATFSSAVACVALPNAAHANDFGTCCGDTVRWFTDLAEFKLLPGSFSGSATNDAAAARFSEAVIGWNQITGSRLKWSITFDDDNTRTSRGDGTEVWFSNQVGDGSVLATTYTKWGICWWPFCDEEISEADIRFWNFNVISGPINWNVDPLPGSYFQREVPDPNNDPGFAPSDAQNFFVEVASHEIGHASGLTHTLVPGARMEDFTPNGGWFHRGALRATPLTNDHSEMRRIYPTSGSAADTYAIGWQTSIIGSTVPVTADPFLFDLSQTPVNRTLDRGDDGTAVIPGDVIGVRFCVGNLGNAAHGTTALELWLSTDQEVDTGDAASPTVQAFTFPADSFGCFTQDFVVPTVAPGRYYVGLWLNRGSDVGISITNDVTLLGRRLNVL